MKFENTDDWRAFVRQLPAELAAIDRTGDDDGVRSAVYACWRAIACAPSTVQHLYSLTSEARILELAAVAEARLNESAFGFESPTVDDDAAMVRTIGAHLRALERSLSGLDEGLAPVDPNVDWKIEHAGDEAFLIPMPRRAWRDPKDPASDFRRFEQRGILRVRLIPKYVDGARVTLVRPDRVASKSAPRAFASVLFEALSFETDDDETTFLVTAVSVPDRDEQLGVACQRSHTESCVATIFPELTIDDGARKRIEELLAEKPWTDQSSEPLATPTVVLAGSWHEPVSGGHANIATVYDGDGEELIRHRKRYAYRGDDGLSERIIPGNELAILVLDEGLFAVGICLDFCYIGYDTVYGPLDVDFVLVTSCGNATTMAGHIRTATELGVSRQTRSFVVQQAYPALPKGRGFVLPPDGRPTEKTADGTISSDAWSVFLS